MEQILGGSGRGDGAAAADLIKDSGTATFMQDVVEASRDAPVIVDFWAPWCGPCKQLTPVLEKVVTEAAGAVRMVKVNIDENPQIAQQLRIQSIPTVFAFSAGRPVDGFAGALPESQVRAFIDRLASAAGTKPESPVAAALEQAKERFDAGDHDAAGAIYTEVLEHEPDNLAARAGLARYLVATGDLAGASEALTAVPEDKRSDPDIAAAWSALELAQKGAGVGDFRELEDRVAANPADLQARYDLALALYAAGRKEPAVDALIEIVRRDRTWSDDAARKQLLQFFEAEGPTDPLTVSGRRKLSSVLFS